MITNDGKEVISKYLLGQAPSYATHISIGCGADPLDLLDPEQSDASTKKRMNFEMNRVPIISKGFVEEDGITKIAFTAKLPTENRYEITEVGLWSSANNSLAKGFDSRTIFDFEENWEAHDSTIEPVILLSDLGSNGVVEDNGLKIFKINNEHALLEETERRNRKEGPRFLNNSIFVRGDSANIESIDFNISSASSDGTLVEYTSTSSSNTFVIGDNVTISGCADSNFDFVSAEVTSVTSNSFTITKPVAAGTTNGGIVWKTGTWTPEEDEEGFMSKHIHLKNISLNISKNNPSDIISFAFSVIDKTSIGSGTPEYVKILIEFLRNELNKDVGFAKAEIYIPSYALTNDRYKVISFPVSDLINTPDFSSDQITVAKIYCQVTTQGVGSLVGSDEHYVALDGIRIDNVSTVNPLYKMVGYSSTRTVDGYPIIKYRNSNNFVEFRFGIGVT